MWRAICKWDFCVAWGDERPAVGSRIECQEVSSECSICGSDTSRVKHGLDKCCNVAFVLNESLPCPFTNSISFDPKMLLLPRIF